jgi:hypothetical protein
MSPFLSDGALYDWAEDAILEEYQISTHERVEKSLVELT